MQKRRFIAARSSKPTMYRYWQRQGAMKGKPSGIIKRSNEPDIDHPEEQDIRELPRYKQG